MRRSSLALSLVTVTVAVAALVASACTKDDEPACYAGDQIACTCPGDDDGRARGFRACDASRTTFGACLCDGTTPGVDAGLTSAPDSGPETGTAGKRGFLEACTANTECESGLCFPFAAKGARCTRRCKPETTATDCPPPSTGCNNQGVCKAP